MNQAVGFRINLNRPHPSEDIVNNFRGVTSGNVLDPFDRSGAIEYQIKPLSPDATLSGPALTVRAKPGMGMVL